MTEIRVRACLSFDIDGLALYDAKRALGVATPDGLKNLMRQDQTVFFDRLLAFYERIQAPQTVFIPAVTAEAEPGRLRRLIGDGHEIGFHGWGHLPFFRLQADQERSEFRDSVAMFQDRFGVRLRGMRAPSYGLSRRTPYNLVAAGMIYDSSAVAEFLPGYVAVGRAGYWSLPTHAQLDDWAHCVYLPELGYGRPARPAGEVLQVYKETFNKCYERGGCFVTVWHPFVTLSDRYIRVAEALADYIVGHEGVAFCTLAAMAEALEAQRAAYPPEEVSCGSSHGASITRV